MAPSEAPAPQILRPCWPAPANVQALSTTRTGGVSVAPYTDWNLGDHVGDQAAAVEENRRRLAVLAGLAPDRIGWLQQVHGTAIVRLSAATRGQTQADASVTTEAGLACAILTADCLPVLFCDQQGRQVAAAHAGWRSLAGGVLEQTLECFPRSDQVMAWLGPAIGPGAFQVGEEVRQAFMAHDVADAAAFVAQGERYLADIYQLARNRLTAAGIGAVYGGGDCTFSDSQRFFSYRRDGRTGRMASLIWLT